MERSLVLFMLLSTMAQRPLSGDPSRRRCQPGRVPRVRFLITSWLICLPRALVSQIQSQPWPDAEEEAPTPSPPPKDVPPVKRPAPPPVKQRHQKSAPVTRKRVYFDDSDEEEERPTITASCKPQRPLPPPVKQPGREPKEVPPVKRRAPSSVEKPCPGPVPDKRKPPVNRDEKDEPSKPGGSGSSVVKPSTTDTPVGKKAERASIDDNGKSGKFPHRPD